MSFGINNGSGVNENSTPKTRISAPHRHLGQREDGSGDGDELGLVGTGAGLRVPVSSLPIAILINRGGSCQSLQNIFLFIIIINLKEVCENISSEN